MRLLSRRAFPGRPRVPGEGLWRQRALTATVASRLSDDAKAHHGMDEQAPSDG